MKEFKSVLNVIAIGILASQLPTGNIWIGIAEIILVAIALIDIAKYCK